MRLDREHFGRVTINGTQVDLGHAPFSVMLRRVMEQYLKHQAVNKRSRVLIEFSEERITSDIDPLKRLEMEFQPEYNSRDEEVSPGITMGALADAVTEPTFQRWQLISCTPANRMKLSGEEVAAIRDEFDSKYPGWRDAGHPPWND